MPALGWLCCVVVVLLVGGLTVMTVIDRRRRKQVLATGDYTVGWLVQANQALFKDGSMDLPGLVLVSPDKVTAEDEAFMLQLADDVFALKGRDPKDLSDPDEAFLAKLMADETYVEGKRDPVPAAYANGRTVYLAHIFIYRDDLPGKKLAGRRVPCALIWNEPTAMICSRPATLSRSGDDD